MKTKPPAKRPRGAQKGSKNAAKWSEPTVKRTLALPLTVDARLIELARLAECSPAVYVAGLIQSK